MKRTYILLFVLSLAAQMGFGQSMSSSIMIAHTQYGVRWSQMTFSPDGVAHFVWEEHGVPGGGHGIMYANYDGTSISNPLMIGQTVQAGEVFMARPYISSSPKGHIIIVWGESNTVYMRIYDSVQKKWLPVEVVKMGWGQDEPQAIMDKDGDILVWWFWDGAGRVLSRFKIGGTWEETRLISGYAFAKQGGMVLGSDGWIWAAWREKQGNGEYKMRYSKRKKTTNWTPVRDVNDAGGSSSHPHVAIGPDNLPVIGNGDIDEATGHAQEMWIIKLDEKTNPRELAIPIYMQHYPRVAVDADGKIHVACAIGGGDYGDGVRYTHNISGTWKDVQTFGAGWPKTPGISHNGFNNIAICWSAMFDPDDGGTRINMSSLYPVERIKLYAPSELSANMSFDPNDTTKFTYNFSWKENSQNKDKFLKGYRIYKKDGETLQELVTVSKTETSATLVLNEFNESSQFGVSTVGLNGMESEMSLFSITYPQIYAPIDLAASIKLSRMKTGSSITYDLRWAANPQNTPDSYVKEYRLYKKESGGEYVLLQTLSKTSFSASVTVPSSGNKVLFAITTVSVLNKESSMAVFGQ